MANEIFQNSDINSQLILNDFSKNFILTNEQNALYRALQEKDAKLKESEKDTKLSEVYIGCLRVLNSIGDPENLVLAAHEMRELMEKLPEVIDMPFFENKSLERKKGTLREKVNLLVPKWNKVIKNKDFSDNSCWKGQIDKSLEKFLVAFSKFINWHQQWFPTYRERFKNTFRLLDPSGRALPEHIEDQNFKSWNEIYKYFEDVSHHRKKTTRVELINNIRSIEYFLLDRLIPKTSKDWDELDGIIQEAER